MTYFGSVRWTATAVAGVLLAGAYAATADMAVVHAGQERLLSDGVYSEGQARRGRRVYRQACASCHANGLEGGEMGPGLRGAPFLDPWEGESLSELMSLVRQTMPQDNPGGLTDEQYTDVLAYMLQANDFPPCDCELTAETIEDVVIETGQ